MLKKLPNIYSYSVFNSFILFSSLKRFLISLVAASTVPIFRFVNLNRFIISLIAFSFKSWSFYHYMLWRSFSLFFEKIKIYHTP